MEQWWCFCIANFSMAFGESEDIFIDEWSEENSYCDYKGNQLGRRADFGDLFFNF